MNTDDAKAALYPVGLVGALGLFLPGLDKSWGSTPDDPEAKERLRAGEVAYLILALAFGLLAARATKNIWAFILTFGWACAVIGMHEFALHHRPKD